MSLIIAKPHGEAIAKELLKAAFTANGGMCGFAVASTIQGEAGISFRSRYDDFDALWQGYLKESQLQKTSTLFYLHGEDEVFENIEDDQPVCILDDCALAVDGPCTSEPFVEELEGYLTNTSGVDDVLSLVNSEGYSVGVMLDPYGDFYLPDGGEKIGRIWFSNINFNVGAEMGTLTYPDETLCSECNLLPLNTETEQKNGICFSCWGQDWLSEIPDIYTKTTKKSEHKTNSQTNIPFAAEPATPIKPARKPCIPQAIFFYGN